MTVSCYTQCPAGFVCLIAAVNDTKEKWTGTTVFLCLDSSNASNVYLDIMMCMLIG